MTNENGGVNNGDDKPFKVNEALPTSAYGLIAWAVNKVGPGLVVVLLVLQFGGLPLLNEVIQSNKEGRESEREQTKLLEGIKMAQDATKTAVEVSDQHKAAGVEQLVVEQRKTREAIDESTKEQREARAVNMKLLLESIEKNRIMLENKGHP